MSDSLHTLDSSGLRDLLALATDHLRNGRTADAFVSLQSAVVLRPRDASLLHDLGLAQLELGYLEQAIATLQQSVEQEPCYADAWFRLGIAREKYGDVGGALFAYDRATTLMPALTEAWYRAGALAYTLGHRDEAVACFRRAAGTGQKTPFGRLGKARALLTENRDDEAEKVLRKTLASDPGNALAHDLLGNLLSEFGRFQEARACFERAIDIAPLLAGSYYDLVRCRRITADDSALVQKMQAALATPALESVQRHRLHLALGKAADDLGDYALAMQQFDEADAVRRTTSHFDALTFTRAVDRLINRCSAEWLAQGRELGRGEQTPILIVGMPRSGTTLAEQILSSHPLVGAGGELNFWNEWGATWHAQPDGTDQVPLLRTAAADYLRLLREMGPRKTCVTDKMPFNFLWVGLIHLAFPNATIIHCRRSAVDTALSIHQTNFHPGLAFPTGGADLVHYFHDYARLTAHWRTLLPPDRYIEVDYEDLTANPEPNIRRMIAACGLPWDDACLSPERNTRTVRTPSKWQTRQSIYGSSVARWKRYEPWLGPLKELIGK